MMKCKDCKWFRDVKLSLDSTDRIYGYCWYLPSKIDRESPINESEFCSKFESKDTSEEVEFDRLFKEVV